MFCVWCVCTAPACDYRPVCDAFAHWCYQISGGRVMVVDVQGWYDEDKQKAILTDPCVHCSVVGLLDNEDRTLVGAASTGCWSERHVDHGAVSD